MVRQQVLNTCKCCTEAQKKILNKPVSNEEIKEAFFKLLIDKSPGPDGYTSGFFKDSRDIMGSDIFSENQGALIKGRSIIEIVLICQDIVKMYNRQAVSPRCLFKIDLQKAYDTFEWSFRKEVLRQGDPISPLMFALCMDYLTRMMQIATDRWPFQYHPLCKNLKLNHLIFADDLLMFCKGNVHSIMLMMRAFSSFSKAFGLSMNSSKSEVYYNGVAQAVKDDINIEAVCRNYLWDGSADYHRVPSVGWDEAHIKGRSWHDNQPPADVAWSWKNVCKVKDLIKDAYVEDQWAPDSNGFTIRRYYDCSS
ncbi:uncharacterized protein LOC141640019 [Silene latifolia]|uniref:uncharacterized protein LOC141640019 n=1 Tax=Silene latifolia TaxID=37657 RepID=UPI003D787F23